MQCCMLLAVIFLSLFLRIGIVPNSYIPVSIFVASSAGLPSSELTVAEVAKQAGYSTALLGLSSYLCVVVYVLLLILIIHFQQ